MADDLGEKTEEATPRRKEEARSEGNVARSQDLAGALLLVGTTIALWWLAASMLLRGGAMLETLLDHDAAGNPLDPDDIWTAVLYVGAATARIAMPILLLAALAAFLAHFWQVGWLLAPKAVQPQLNRLNPSNGLKRIFGISALVKVSLDVLKLVVVLAIALITIQQYKSRIVALPYFDVWPAVLQIGKFILDLSLRMLVLLLLLGIIDYLYQKWKHAQDLKMTKQQVKDEMKSSEGDPETKRRRLRMQQQIAMQRISAAVPRADVVVTNPEHIAVALAYDPERMNAPKVVAKGADYLALRIRQLAARHGVPIIERPPLARALYREVEVGQEVPPQFYKAVAEILAYVYRLSGRMAG